MITEKTPNTWKELQNWTAQILSECGMKAQSEHTLETVRGKVELDVFATESVEGRQYTHVVECKNWATNIPQNVVHGFRTVLADLGINNGYIVSRAGFQSGARQAAQNTNVLLLTWEEFQAHFEVQWYWKYFAPMLSDRLDPLCSYLEPLPAMASWDQYLQESEVGRLSEMYAEHFSLGMFIMRFHPAVSRIFDREIVRLPLDDSSLNLPTEIKELRGYREFATALEKYTLPILDEFRHYRDIAFARRAEKGERGPSYGD